MAENATAGAGAAVMSGLDEVVSILLDVVLPIVLVLAGVFTYSWLGGATSIAGLMTQAKLSSGIANHVAPLVPAAIAFSIGGGFWGALGGHKNLIARAIGKLVGAYFLGVGFGYVLNAAFGNPTPGALDKLIGATSDAVRPGGG
jgi:hypothetical protein